MVTQAKKQSCSCSCPSRSVTRQDWMEGDVKTTIGNIPVVKTALSTKDIFDGWKTRWNIGRMSYKISPGIYAVGAPDNASPLLVTANYKLTFDRTRKELEGLNLWLLVLDTKGINVWCAAGKGTFGTEELVRRLKEENISRLVSHKKVIIPQLGAPGISAHKVTAATGFKVVYGPIRASDIRAFLNNRMTASPEMRQVRFGIGERLALGPLELVFALRLIPYIIAFVLILQITQGPLRFQVFVQGLLPFLAAVFAGTLIFPVLLPWLPGRAFSIRGWILGAMVAAGASFIQEAGLLNWIVNLMWLPPLTAHLSLRFTGSTTFTSLSGVEREVKYFYPVMLVSFLVGIIMVIVQPF